VEASGLKLTIAAEFAAGYLRSLRLLDALVADIAGLCDPEQQESFETVRRRALRYIYFRKIDGPGTDFDAHVWLRDLRLDAARHEFRGAYDENVLKSLDGDTAAQRSDFRWSVEEAMAAYHMAIDGLVARYVRHATTPPSPDQPGLMRAGTPEHDEYFRSRARSWRVRYDALTKAAGAIEHAAREALGDEAADEWRTRVRLSIAPSLMKPMWAEEELERWLCAADLDDDEREAVLAAVGAALDRMRAERDRAFAAAISARRRHGLQLGSQPEQQRYADYVERVIQQHDRVIEAAISALPAAPRRNLETKVATLRSSRPKWFGEGILISAR
jgi:hypothetical protein